MIDAKILVIDDEPINIEILLEYLADETSSQPDTAGDGESAWQLLQDSANKYQLILLDRMMPGIDGIELLQRIKNDSRLAAIPVIMQTAASSAEQIREGLEAGAYYYLTKPYRRAELLAIVHAALSDARNRDALRQQLHRHIDALGFLDEASFTIRTIDEADRLASFIAQACADPGTAVIGIAELLINGIEHGNLGISYAEKLQLKRADTWREEIDRRSGLAEYAGKRLRVSLRREPQQINLRVADEGEGFAWENYLEMQPGRAFDPNGRGIALARMLSFSSISYEGCGNVARATIPCNQRS
ncbi:MAG: response regulator receiver protein [Betaproteobacteria bacterium HGW-Betaproteobacteria-7]|jgi:DNA-binding response OmpR family regulator|nr:MAG: response regulator receiver protein [Betaproteobacteria bacterium HGW-Betaproteobacteria-7]